MLVYMDDIIISSKSRVEGIEKFRKAEIEYLGHIITENKVFPLKLKIKAAN